jgi:hypothetical protein
MGKKLVIKGADFSENGFVFELVKKEITTLYKSDGAVASPNGAIINTETRYFYEYATSGALTQGTNLSKACYSTSPDISGTFVDVEDYTDAEVTSICNFGPSGNIAGFAIMFFLDSSKNIIGGLSTGDSQVGCVNKGASSELRTFKMSVPAGSKYVVCTFCSNASTNVGDFKLTLSKKVIQ